MMKKIIKYIAAHKIITGIVVVVLIGIGYFTYTKLHGSTVATQYVFGQVSRGDLVVSVSGTGQASTLSKVEIKPQTTGQTQTLGQIIKVNVQNGQAVKAGDVIAILDGKNALQSLNQSKASVTSAQANYDKLIGPSSSSLGSTSPSVQSAQLSLKNATQNLATKLQTDYISVSNAVYLNTDPFFVNPSVNATLTIPDTYFTNQELAAQVNNQRRSAIIIVLDALKKDLANVLTSSDPVSNINDAIAKFTIIRTYFDDMTTLLTNYTSSISSAGQSAIDSDKVIASNARSTANTAISDLVSSLQSYESTSLSLNQTVASLPDDIAVAQSQLDNAKANLANAQETYASRIITAPFDGQIGGLVAQVGQQVSSSDVLGYIITPQKVVNVSLNEVDAAKVKADDAVILTFDALPNVTINGHVSFVDPLGTVTQGVVNYSVQIAMDDQNDQIKTGMTATASIVTDIHTNVLMVPLAAITKTGNRNIVLVPNTTISSVVNLASSTATTTGTSTRIRGNGARIFGANGTNSTTAASTATTATVHPVPVVVGISNDTLTEIISGLNEGDTIVTRTITGTGTTAASTARAGSIFGMGGGGAGGGSAVRTGGAGGGGGRSTTGG